MNPNEKEPDDVHPIADRNTERLLAGAYRPEMPDPSFLAQVTTAMHAVAGRRAKPAQAVPVSRSQSAAKRWIGWVAAAGVLLALGVVAGTILRARPSFQRQDGTIWIDGRAYVEAETAPGDQPTAKNRLKAELQAPAVPSPDRSMPQQTVAGTVTPQGAGSVARLQSVAAAVEVLQVGRSVETQSEQRRRLSLPDGSILYLNRDTAVTLTAAREVTLRRGEIYVEVAQDPAASRFIVSTPRRQMIALGTKFDVRVAPAATELLVTQGKVQVSDQQLPVLAGQQLVLDGSAAGPADISAAPRATHTIEWTRELMATAHSPLVPGSKYSGGSLVAVDPQGQETRLSLRRHHVDVHIEDGFARTTIDQTYFNHESARLEGTFYFPLPPDASLSRLAMYVNGRLMEGGMAERQHAREVFESIVYRMKDPALLEWVDGSTFKMRVFPLEGRQEKRIILSYTQCLPSLYGRSEYRFPGGHSLPVVGDWSAHVCVKNGARLEWHGEPPFTATKLAGDLVLDATAKDIRPDRDIVVTMKDVPDASHPHPSPLPEGEGTFSSTISDGSKYLMLRWRPELPGETKRQRRDWIFLFESSGDRDPLLARAQVEIVKTILDNAEHDDTFSILTAATRLHAYDTKPQTATPANVKRAIGFLENVHLVGALDLGRAVEAARPLAEAAKMPVLVHVGSGLPVLGLRNFDALVKRVPQQAAYVGVGVGNRWSRALMKSAAARTGGCFTQINPDEQIAWRALDLFATLNTPRLLSIRVGDGAAGEQFLTCQDSLAQGEQLCAIARFDAATEMPKTVEITGQLGGKPRKWTLRVADVTEQANYLPRTWAKLEIDRLVADGAEKNKARIIELSKSTYVLSPFTSLLVLENEEMYAQYHVDRGRKDHWAMYACAEQIPVVYEPLVGPQGRSGKAEAKGPTAEDVLSTVLVRVPSAILGRLSARPRGVRTVPVMAPEFSLRDRNADHGFDQLVDLVSRDVIARSWSVDNDGDGVPDSTWVDLGLRGTRGFRPLFDQRYRPQGSLYVEIYNPWANVTDANLARFRGAYDDIMAVRVARQKAFVDSMYQAEKWDIPDLDDPPLVYPDAEMWRELTTRRHELYGRRTTVYPSADLVLPVRSLDAQAWQEPAARRAAKPGVSAAPVDPFGKTPSEFGNLSRIVNPVQMEVIDGLDVLVLRGSAQDVEQLMAVVRSIEGSPGLTEPPITYPDAQVWKDITERRKKWSSTELSNRTSAVKKIIKALKEPTQIEFVETPLKDVVDYLKDLHKIEIQLDSVALKDGGVDESTPITKNLKNMSLRSALRLLLDELKLNYVIHNEVLLITSPEKAESEALSGYRPDSTEMLSWLLAGYDRKVPTYEPPVFSNNPAVFYDLVSYAPAMHTNLTDVVAVLEAEAPADAAAAKPGKIDDRARRLIERARGAGWQTATIADPHGKTPLTVAFDGTGRYRYQRTTSAGLREQVVCDGTSLWHLYPELGIGARRTLSRFHRQDLALLVPWALPPVEDLAHGADLVSIDERTVAIVPQELEGPPKGGTTSAPSPAQAPFTNARRKSSSIHASVDAKDAKPLASLRTHLVFAPDGRLAEWQLVEMPSGKIRIREHYGADGTVEFVAYGKENAGGTPAPRRKIQLASCGAPELKPDAALVVLPLPLRSRQHVLGARKLLSSETYGSWSEEDALAVIAADLGDAPTEMKQIIGQRFFRRGDRRLGFYTLLLSTGQTWNPKEKQDFGGGDPLLVDPMADHPNDPLAKYVSAYLASSRPGGPKDLGNPTETGVRDPNDFFRQLAEFHDLWDRWHDGRATGGDESQRRQECQRALAFIEQAHSPELAWGLLMAVRRALSGFELHSGFAGAIQRFETVAAVIQRFETVPGLEYAARYERARALHDAGNGIQARDIFCRLFTETVEAGIVPPVDSSFREALLQGGDGGPWQPTIRAAAKKLIDARARPSAVYLARQVQQVGDPVLAEEVLEMAARDAPESQRLGLTLARVEHYRQTRQLPRADALLQPLLSDKRNVGSPVLWYLAEAIADARGMTARAIGFRQRAMEIEFEHLPEKVNVELIRADYGQLLSRYEKLATAIGPLHEAAPRELLAEVIRAADCWRQLDTDPTAACQAAARILGELGETDLAWDYLTTPLSAEPNEAAGWGDLARKLRQQGHVDLADRAYAAAFDAEPTNAQILWDRAESLWENGRPDQAWPLFQQIAAGPWGPQFSGLQSRAKQTKYVDK